MHKNLQEPKAKIGMYNAMRDLLDEDTILCTNSSTPVISSCAVKECHHQS